VFEGLRRGHALAAAFVAVVLAAALASAAFAGGMRPVIGNPSISLIIFGGKPTNPTITVRGTDLNYEAAQPIPPTRPAYSPSNQPDCPVKINGNAGRDYGTRLYFVDRSAKPEWSAGRYRPGIHELDCIGLIVTHYTSGEVVFHFGAFFKQGHFRLKAGDYVGIVVNNVGTGIIRVKYDVNGVPPA
jgi:hypothetical protein